MNKCVIGLIEATATGDRERMTEATRAYMQAAADALTAVSNDFGGFSLAPMIVVAEAFVESLKIMADANDLVAVEKLRERCTAVTIPIPRGRNE